MVRKIPSNVFYLTMQIVVGCAAVRLFMNPGYKEGELEEILIKKYNIQTKPTDTSFRDALLRAKNDTLDVAPPRIQDSKLADKSS